MELETLGVSHQEYLLYTAILKNPPVNIVELAKNTGINRTTVYAILDSLKEKKLIEQLPASSKIKYRALSPERLRVIAKKSQQRANEELLKLEKQVPILNLFYNKRELPEDTEVYSYKNDELFAQMDEIVDKAKSKICGLSDSHYIREAYKVDKNWKLKGNLYLKTVLRVGERYVFFSSKKVADEARLFFKRNPVLAGKSEMRWIDSSNLYFPLNFNAFDDVVIFTPTRHDMKNLSSIYIRNAQLATAMVNLVNFIWELAEPLGPRRISTRSRSMRASKKS